jgi:hypothetical protein
MRRIAIWFLFIMSLPPFAFGGEIYGDLKEGERSVGQGIKVEIICGGKTYAAETDKYGSYRQYVSEQGKCTLMAYYKEQSPVIEIYSYEGSVRYNLVLEIKDGQYSIRRE